MNEMITELGLLFTIIGMAVVLGIRSIYRFVKGDKTGKCRICASCTCDDVSKQCGKGNFYDIHGKEA